MTEAEWLAGGNLLEMFERGMVKVRASARKARLFACACCRRIWPLMGDERARRAVEIAEAFADGQPGLKKAQAEAQKAEEAAPDDFLDVACLAARAAAAATRPGDQLWRRQAYHCAYEALSAVLHDPNRADGQWDRERQAQCDLLRDIFGNPFRAVTLYPSWRTDSVLALARAAYRERDMPAGELQADRLAVLADALEEAGCEESVVLEHCRQGAHVRGCWVVDLVLGMS